MPSLSTDYARAYFPKSVYRIFGKRLQTFCLGHELLLQARRSAFSMDATHEPGLGDLCLAIGICSRSGEDAARWHRTFRSSVWLRYMCCRYNWQSKAVNAGILAFHKYYWESWQRPRYSSGSGGTCGAPMVSVLKQTLMAVYGKSEREAFATPFRVALWDHVAWMEREGMVAIPPPIDPDHLEAMRQAAPEALKRWEEWKKEQMAKAQPRLFRKPHLS